MRLPITRSSISALNSAFWRPLPAAFPALRFVVLAMGQPSSSALLSRRIPHCVREFLAGRRIAQPGEAERDQVSSGARVVQLRQHPLRLVLEHIVTERLSGIAGRCRDTLAQGLSADGRLDLRWKIR